MYVIQWVQLQSETKSDPFYVNDNESNLTALYHCEQLDIVNNMRSGYLCLVVGAIIDKCTPVVSWSMTSRFTMIYTCTHNVYQQQMSDRAEDMWPFVKEQSLTVSKSNSMSHKNVRKRDDD